MGRAWSEPPRCYTTPAEAAPAPVLGFPPVRPKASALPQRSAALTPTDGTAAPRHMTRNEDRVELSLIDVGLALFLLVLPHEIGSDGAIRYQALRELIEHGTVSRMQYSFVQPLFSAPLYLIGKLWMTPDWWCARFNIILVIVARVAAFRLVPEGDPRRFVRTCFLVLLGASMLPNHLRGYFGEVFTAVFVSLGILALAVRRLTAGWAAIVIGVVNTPATMLGLGLLCLKRARDERRWRPVVPVLVAAALVMAEAWMRRGSPFVTGYEGVAGIATVMPYSNRAGFSYPLFFGLVSILFSFGKGLVWFAPGLLLRMPDRTAIDDRLRTIYALLMWFLIGMIVVYAKWWAWYGGWYWGPRFFLIASVPASLAIAVRLRTPQQRSLTSLTGLVVVLTLSTWVAVDGALFDQRGLDLCLA